MKYNISTSNAGFTMIELLISITIFALIMVSVFVVFIFNINLNNRTDISRAMQENVKNIVEILSEDIRQHSITGVGNDGTCENNDGESDRFSTGNTLCVGNNTYYIAKQVSEDRIFEDDMSECMGECSLVRRNLVGAIAPLTNSWVDFEEMSFYVADSGKVMVQFIIIPSIRKGISFELIQDHKMVFQTTLSERYYK